MLPKEIAKLVPKTHLMSESEWRSIGVQQSQGWVHYMIHEPGQLELQSSGVERLSVTLIFSVPSDYTRTFAVLGVINSFESKGSWAGWAMSNVAVLEVNSETGGKGGEL